MGLAFFDLDNTLIAGDSAQAFSEFMAACDDLATPADFLQRNHAYMDDYERGDLDLPAYMHYTLLPLIDLPPERVVALVQRFVSEVVEGMVLPKAVELLQRHRSEGDEIVIISATGSHLVHPIAAYLGVEHSLAVDIERVDDKITGHLTGVPTFREGKVTRAIGWADERGYDIGEAYFYSDSHNDLPLLERARYPVAVDPDVMLKEVAASRGWPILSLR